MCQLVFDHLSYLDHGQRRFLISGEIHYFRVPRAEWRDRLTKFKDMGGNCVGTYVPWLLHEPSEGVFRFDDPQYDVEAFLDLCAEMGLWVIVRPGPYQYAELKYAGLASWLCEGDDELLARTVTGSIIDKGSVSYLHPRFLEKAHRWYHAIIPRLARHQVAQGGTVVMAQIDNEMIGVHEWASGSWDYHPVTMGVGRETGRWPDFLRARYGDLAQVNAAFGLQATCWAEVCPIARLEATPTPESRRLVKEYQDCYLASIAEYAALLADWMHDDGITVPIIHNSGNPGMNADFRETVMRLGKDFLLGSDHYYNLDITWKQNNPTPQYTADIFLSLEMLRHYGVPPTVLELPGGSLANYPPFTAHDAACCYLANIAYGMKGFNLYIFAGGSNPPGMGSTGDVYDYDAALSVSGEKRPLYDTLQHLASFLHQHEWLAGAHRVNDCHIGHSWEYARSKYYGAAGKDLPFSSAAAEIFARDGLFLTASYAGFSPNYADLTSDDILHDAKKPLLVASSSSMAADQQQRLIDFLEAGGRLLLAPVVPTLNEQFQPCTLIADYLGGVEQTSLSPELTLFSAAGVECVYANGGGLLQTTRRPDDAVNIAREERSGCEIGWQLALPSGGVVSVLGVHWRLNQHKQTAMLDHLLRDLGIDPVVRCDNPYVWTSLRTDGQRAMIFVLNLFTVPMTAHVQYRDPCTGVWVDTGTHTIPGITVQAWEGTTQCW